MGPNTTKEQFMDPNTPMAIPAGLLAQIQQALLNSDIPTRVSMRLLGSLQQLAPVQVTVPQVTEAMVDRFLAWPLPESVCATQQGPGRNGATLLNAVEAKAMLEHALGGPE